MLNLDARFISYQSFLPLSSPPLRPQQVLYFQMEAMEALPCPALLTKANSVRHVRRFEDGCSWQLARSTCCVVHAGYLIPAKALKSKVKLNRLMWRPVPCYSIVSIIEAYLKNNVKPAHVASRNQPQECRKES